MIGYYSKKNFLRFSSKEVSLDLQIKSYFLINFDLTDCPFAFSITMK